MRILSFLVLAVLPLGCGLTVTKERPAYKDLDAKEQEAIEIVLRELTAFNGQVKQRTIYNIDEVVDRERINVSFERLIFSGNIGDDVIHIGTWENLGPGQHLAIQGWFQTTAEGAEQTYKTFFYQFMAVVQGVKQFMYKVLTPAWLFDHRSLFNIERDSIRNAMAHYSAVGRRAEMWNFLGGACKPLRAQYDATYSANFNKVYLIEHLPELAEPENPIGYMYFICRWIDLGTTEAEDLTIELNWLRDLPL